MKKLKPLTKKTLLKMAASSSKMEGISFARARKNKWAIKKLRQHGRAFSL